MLAPLSLRVVGIIRSPFVEAAGTPIQPCYIQGAEGKVQVDEAFAAALDDIEGFERVWPNPIGMSVVRLLQRDRPVEREHIPCWNS